MDSGSAALPRTIAVFDVEAYGDPIRTNQQRLALRSGLYRVLEQAFAEAGVPWEQCQVDDTGDGLLLLIPSEISKIRLVDQLPQRLDAGLRRHNGDHSNGARIRLRLALHAGEINFDRHGLASQDVIHASRILDAQEAKRALKASTATLVIIASKWFYDSVVVQDPAAEPESFHRIAVAVKETAVDAWMRLVGDRVPQQAPTPTPRVNGPTLAQLDKIVGALLATPGFDTREGRDLVLRQLDSGIWSVIARHPTDRADVMSIVRTCWKYPGALRNLVDTVRFFAAGSIAMGTLETAIAEVDRN
jgi:hypothetical protein